MRHAIRAMLVPFLLALSAHGAWTADDPLPSWRDTATKQAIVAFVSEAVREGEPGFVPAPDRIATFDMDGTLIPEKPVPAALVPLRVDLERAVAAKPILQDRPAVSAFLKGDLKALAASGEEGINELIAILTEGKSTEEFARNILPLIRETRNAKYGVSYVNAVYRPMVELLDYLEANGFETWVCSGSPILFTRAVSTEMLGIPPERVMGSRLETKLDERDGRTVLVFTGAVAYLNDREGKPVTIDQALGKRPVFVGGNEGGRGDIAMMRWSKDRQGPSFQLLIDHNDGTREFDYEEADNYSLDAARKYGFHVVSMKEDWKSVVAPPVHQAP